MALSFSLKLISQKLLNFRADEINRAIKILESKNMIDEESKTTI